MKLNHLSYQSAKTANCSPASPNPSPTSTTLRTTLTQCHNIPSLPITPSHQTRSSSHSFSSTLMSSFRGFAQNSIFNLPPQNNLQTGDTNQINTVPDNHYPQKFQNESAGIGARLSQLHAMSGLLRQFFRPAEAHLNVDGKFFEISSFLTLDGDPRDYCWFFTGQGSTDDPYRLTYDLKKNNKHGSILSKDGQLPEFLNQNCVAQMHDNLAAVEKELFKTYSKQTAKNILSQYYEWVLTTSGKRTLQLCAKTSHPHTPLFGSEYLPAFLNFTVVEKMLALQQPNISNLGIDRSDGALYGACAGMSAKWLSLIYQGDKSLIEEEENIAKWYEITGGSKSNSPSSAQKTKAQRRIDCLNVRHAAASALLQKIFNTNHTDFHLNYYQQIWLLERIATESKFTADDINREIFRLENEWEPGKYEQETVLARQHQIKELRLKLDDTIQESNQWTTRAQEAKQTLNPEDKQGYLVINQHFKTVGLDVTKVDVASRNHPPQHFIQSLINEITVGSGAQYIIGFQDVITGEDSVHATALFRENANAFTFFDPNAGEFYVPNEELEPFLTAHYLKWFESMPTEKILVHVTLDSKQDGLQAVLKKKIRIYEESVQKEKTAEPPSNFIQPSISSSLR